VFRPPFFVWIARSKDLISTDFHVYVMYLIVAGTTLTRLPEQQPHQQAVKRRPHPTLQLRML
jgi:hypothetical protein